MEISEHNDGLVEINILQEFLISLFNDSVKATITNTYPRLIKNLKKIWNFYRNNWDLLKKWNFYSNNWELQKRKLLILIICVFLGTVNYW